MNYTFCTPVSHSSPLETDLPRKLKLLSEAQPRRVNEMPALGSPTGLSVGPLWTAHTWWLTRLILAEPLAGVAASGRCSGRQGLLGGSPEAFRFPGRDAASADCRWDGRWLQLPRGHDGTHQP